MGIELRLPNIKGTDKEQLVQIRSYLYQLTEQLQWALNNVNASATNYVVQQIPSGSSSSHLSTTSTGGGFDAEVAFDALKPFIIKSADIVEAYYDEINSMLKGQYVAQSEFGTFIEQTEANITATSTYVDQQYKDVQVIISDEIQGLKVTVDGDISNLNTTVQSIDENISTLDSNVGTINGRVGDLDTQVVSANEQIGDLNSTVNDVNGEIDTLRTKNKETDGKIGELNSAIGGVNDSLKDIRASIIEANAYIRSGLLYYENSIPVYGLEIGQNNTVNGVEVFNKYARFTSDRLTFYDRNDTEVAYISDYKLYIRNVEITSSSKIGGFVDTVMSNGDVVTKWVGRR